MKSRDTKSNVLHESGDCLGIEVNNYYEIYIDTEKE